MKSSRKSENQFRLCLISISLIFCMVVLIAVSYAESPGNKWVDMPEILLYYEAVTKIATQGLNQTPRRQIVQDSLNAYLKSIDPYSHYMTAEEYSAFKTSMKGDFVGIGMEIEKGQQGQIICLPYPDGPAYGAGIRAGDILEEAEDIRVLGKSIFEIAAILKGNVGKPLHLIIRSGKTDETRSITLSRVQINVKSVEINRIENIPIIRIKSFGTGTQRELKLSLGEIRPNEPMVIDLRDNPGGDLHAAIDSAMLFLKKDKTIAKIEKADEAVSYASFGNAINTESPIYIWQNRGTASASEVFIGALTRNNRAASIGERTYGKGKIQDIIALSDNSAMVLTTGQLVLSDGERYHGKGLEPNFALNASDIGDKDYFSEVKKLLSGERKRPHVNLKETEKDVSQKKASETQANQSHASVDKISEIIIAVRPQQYFMVCFERQFKTKEDTEIWALMVKNSLKDVDRQFILKSEGEGSEIFFVCLGPYASDKEAKVRKESIANLMNENVSVELFKGDI